MLIKHGQSVQYEAAKLRIIALRLLEQIGQGLRASSARRREHLDGVTRTDKAHGAASIYDVETHNIHRRTIA